MPAKKRGGKKSRSSPGPKKGAGESNVDVINNSPYKDAPLGAILGTFKPTYTQWVARYVVLSFAVILRSAVGLGPYSGYQSEPMHGDFEAQRHWMEITIHLPITKWYFYDLEWWGLDYPPLTAFHSWVLGQIGSWLDPAWFALDSSRRLDDYDLKSYMRATAIVSELVVYIPAAVWFVRWFGRHVTKQNSIDQAMAIAAILYQPALVLIDHGHFQYNSVMLGFTLLSIVCLLHHRRLLASFFFVLSLGFKQMSLYYAPAIFAYLLGNCVFPSINIVRLLSIGTVVIATFVLIVLPFFVMGGVEQLHQMVVRVFPFARGLWEDKVANVWCTVNTFVKLKQLFSSKELQNISLLATFIAILPSMGIIFYYPRKHLLPWAFSSTAWAFFLFSFQVHEKTVLVPLMPVTILLASTDRDVVAMVAWINNIATFSLWPLLKREELAIQYAVMTFCWNWLIGNITPLRLPSNIFWKLVIIGSYLGIVVLHLAEYLVPSHLYIEKYPDLWSLGNITLAAPCFGLFWVWTLYKLYTSR
ncbi:hypothetical protein TRICI_000154 [Trichomonascus ciferrii]|uniref:Alpha-1,3-glucosyltransferase n=1 Tax=Trichomonascus ciferrii TaxID=44093 RepID=A0A642VEA0_9ASCO|nr:hypothetical protein TRICI_000154 [Trichomonascus ciferrii]